MNLNIGQFYPNVWDTNIKMSVYPSQLAVKN